MLEPLPARPVARFMLPLADVMTVLFSLFLLLPHLEQSRRAGTRTESGAKGGVWTAEEQLQARDELARHRRLAQIPATQRLIIVFVLIDEETGDLLLLEPGRQVPIATEEQVHALIQQHQALASAEAKDLFFILQPMAPIPGKERRHPNGADDERYANWFGKRKVAYKMAGL